MYIRKGFQVENPKSFARSSDLSLPSKPRHHSHHWHLTPVPGDYQIRSCSSWAVISHFRIKGAWAAAPVEQFASLPRDLGISACANHSLRHGKAISLANQQLHWTPPSLKTSPLFDLGFVLLGFHRKQKISVHLRFSSWCLHTLSGAVQPTYQWYVFILSHKP